jgi:hypothetical protein
VTVEGKYAKKFGQFWDVGFSFFPVVLRFGRSFLCSVCSVGSGCFPLSLIFLVEETVTVLIACCWLKSQGTLVTVSIILDGFGSWRW